jgi:hypothetical protein
MDKLNGYTLTKQWFEFIQSGEHDVKPVHSALYFYIIHLSNQLKWPQKFGLPTENTMQFIGVSNYRTYINALKNLSDWGVILWVEKSYNQHTCNKIALVKKYKALSKHIPKQVQSIASISKRIKTYKNVVSVETKNFAETKTGLFQKFKNIRPEIPEQFLNLEISAFLNKYPGKENEVNLVNTWAKRIVYQAPVSAMDEFNKLESENKRKYGF